MNAWAWLLLLLGANGLLLLLPMLPALYEWRRRDTKPLYIPSDDEAGIEFFAIRFRQRLLAQWGGHAFFEPASSTIAHGRCALPPATAGAIASSSSGYRIASPEEQVAGQHRASDASEPVLIGDHIRLADGADYIGDIYARSRLVAAHDSMIRSVLSNGDVELGSGCSILRWAHARRLSVGDGSRVMARLSAQESITIGKQCRFERLKAPVITVGGAASAYRAGSADQYTETVAFTKRQPPAPELLRWHAATRRWTSRASASLPADCVIDGDLIVHGNLVLGTGCLVTGSIKAYGDVETGTGTSIHGNCFAHGSIRIAKGSRVFGQVSSMITIDIGDDCIVGRPEHPASVIAPRVEIVGRCRIHGSVWARETGRTLPA